MLYKENDVIGTQNIVGTAGYEASTEEITGQFNVYRVCAPGVRMEICVAGNLPTTKIKFFCGQFTGSKMKIENN